MDQVHSKVKNRHNSQSAACDGRIEKMAASAALVVDKMKVKPRDIYRFHVLGKPEADDRASAIFQVICILNLCNRLTQWSVALGLRML